MSSRQSNSFPQSQENPPLFHSEPVCSYVENSSNKLSHLDSQTSTEVRSKKNRIEGKATRNKPIGTREGDCVKQERQRNSKYSRLRYLVSVQGRKQVSNAGEYYFVIHRPVTNCHYLSPKSAQKACALFRGWQGKWKIYFKEFSKRMIKIKF